MSEAEQPSPTVVSIEEGRDELVRSNLICAVSGAVSADLVVAEQLRSPSELDRLVAAIRPFVASVP